MSLYQRCRPQTFDEVVGEKNRRVIASIEAMLAGDDPPHAYGLFGPSGCGKTSTGRLIAKSLGVSDDDFHEVDSADFRGIDMVRGLRRAAYYKALNGERRCWLIDECHRLTGEAQDSLLKGLEDPPPHCYYVLCTTDPNRLIPTILSRLTSYQVHPLSDGEMLRLLSRAASREGKPVARPALQAIVDQAAGRPRAGLVMLEKLIADPDATEEVLAGAEVARRGAIDLCRALMGGQGWRPVASILTALKDEDVETVRRAVLGYCGAILLKGEKSDRAALVMDEFVAPFYDSGWPGLIHSCYTIIRADA